MADKLLRRLALTSVFMNIIDQCITDKTCVFFRDNADTTTECVHGSRSDVGECVCQECWGGVSCDIYENNKPYFDLNEYDAYLRAAPIDGQHIFTAEAIDDDTSKWPPNSPCVKVQYDIVDGDPAFSIDDSDGSVYIQDASRITGGPHRLTIQASNDEVPGQPLETSQTNLTVHYDDTPQPKKGVGIEDEVDQSQDTAPHHRSRRAVSEDIIPENATFTLMKTGKYEHVTTMRVGDKVSFRLIIHFPMGTTDMLVELFTPDNTTAVMKLCNPTIAHVGSNLEDSFDYARATPKMDAKDKGFIYDRAVLDLGNITNTGADGANNESSMIFIDYDAVMINHEVPNNTKYWVSAGAEYNNENEIWVGQAAFAALLDDMLAPRQPSFNLTGPSEIALDSSGVFLVDMFVSDPSTNIRVDAFAPLNTTAIMSVCGISIADTDKNYACLPRDAYTAVFSESDTGAGNWHGTLDLGRVINAGSREDTSVMEHDRITVAILTHMFEDGSAVDEIHNFGVAVEVGDLIWAATAKVKAIAPPTLPEMAEAPKFVIKPITSTDAFIGRPSVIELDMIVPENTMSEYDLEVITPDNGTVSFKVCGVSVIYSGENVACVRDKPAEFFKDDGSTTTNRAVLNLGFIRNYVVSPNKTEANVVRFEIVVQALNTSSYTVGERYWVTMGVNFTQTKMWVGQQAYYIQEPAEDEPRTNPTYKMSYSFGSDNVSVGDAREILYEMHTVPGAVYQPAYIEVIMPDNVTTDGGKAPVFSICGFRVVSAGKNVPCINATSSTEDIIYEDKFGSGVYDKARLSMTAICNTGRYPSADENKVIFAVRVRVEDHPSIENGAKEWVSLGMMLTNDTMWVGQVAMFALLDSLVVSNPSGNDPYIGLEMTSNITGDIPVGYFVTHELYLKIPARASMTYKVNVTSKSPDLSICSLRLMKTGSHLPCMAKSIKAIYTTFENSQRQNEAYIDLGPITSFGPEGWEVNQTNEFSDDTVLMEVTTKLWTDTGSHDFDVLLTLSDSDTHSATGTLDATSDHSEVNSNDTVESPPNVTFYMVDIVDTEAENATTEIGRGEVKRFISDVIIRGDFLSHVIVKFFTPLNNAAADVEICGAQLISVGTNIPCVHKSEVQSTYEIKSSGVVNDVATIDLGYVCMIPLEEITNDTNTLRFEGIMKVNPETTLTTAKVTSSLRVGDTYIIMSDLPLTIMDTLTQPDFVYVNETNSTIPSLEFNLTAENMTIGQKMAVPVILTVPPNTTGHTLVDIKLPVNDSAHMTVEGIKVISAGINIACFYDFSNLNTSFLSTQNTSQNDGAYVDFGTLANTGFSYRGGSEPKPEDDQIVIEFEIQMADSLLNEDKSWHEISTAVEYGGVIILVSDYIQVIRNNTEKVELKLIAECDVTTPLSPDDLLTINGVLQHLNTSTAEGINVTASFYLPPYVTYLDLNYSNLEATVDRADGSIVRVEFPRVFFTDMVFFGILLQVLSNASAPLSLMDAITPYEMGTTMHYRDGSIYSDGEFFTTELDDVSYRVFAQPETSCSDALGMESGVIKDCQISGSVSPDSTKLPKHGRLNGPSGWSPFRRDGKHNEQRHLQVYFGNRAKVSHIKIQHPGSYTSERVTELQVYYSDDGDAWLPGEKLIPSPSTYTTADLPVLTPRESRYIRLYVLKNTGAETDLVGLQVEFFGCLTTTDVTDPCPARPAPVPEFTDRLFLSTGTEVFVCDAEPDIDLTMQCVTSTNGNDWKMLDRTVGNIIGYNPVTDEIFAIATDGVTYLLSLDKGLTWSCILPETWTAAAPACIRQVSVPWTQDADLQAPQPSAAFTQDSWGATAAGMFYNGGSWDLRLDWASCC